MKNILLIISAFALLSILFKRKYAELTIEQNNAHVTKPDHILNVETGEPQKKKPLPKNFAPVNSAFRKGEMAFAKGDITKAQRWFIKTLALYEHHEEALNRLGVIAIQNGELLKAELLYRRLLSLNLKEPVYYCNYGRALYNQKKLKEAAQAYEMAIILDPGKSTRFISLGQVYYELGETDKALEKFMEASRLAPRNIEYLELLADLCESAGKHEILMKILEKILALNPYDERSIGRLKKTRSGYKVPEQTPENEPSKITDAL